MEGSDGKMDSLWGLYRDLPTEVKEDETLIQQTKDPQRFVVSFVSRNVRLNRQKELEKIIKHKEVIMDTMKIKKRGKRDGRRKRGEGYGGGGGQALSIPQGRSKKKLSLREKKKLGLFDIPAEQQKYELYEPLHQLWLDYMRETLELPNANKLRMESRLLKCDLHGCVLTVTRSKCSSYIGTAGIVIQETRNVFKIITKENKLKIIPKSQCWFMFTVDQFAVTIYGQHFCQRSSVRSAKKFKSKPTIDL